MRKDRRIEPEGSKDRIRLISTQLVIGGPESTSRSTPKYLVQPGPPASIVGLLMPTNSFGGNLAHAETLIW